MLYPEEGKIILGALDEEIYPGEFLDLAEEDRLLIRMASKWLTGYYVSQDGLGQGGRDKKAEEGRNIKGLGAKTALEILAKIGALTELESWPREKIHKILALIKQEDLDKDEIL